MQERRRLRIWEIIIAAVEVRGQLLQMKKRLFVHASIVRRQALQFARVLFPRYDGYQMCTCSAVGRNEIMLTFDIQIVLYKGSNSFLVLVLQGIGCLALYLRAISIGLVKFVVVS